MSKVFGYSRRNGKDWFTSDAYSDKEIDAILDPEGGNEEFLPTAIPSPFARIDLVKTAFINITKTPDLRSYKSGQNVVAGREDERLVSYTLDLLELLFNADQFKDSLRIILWDRKTGLERLQNGPAGHRKLGEALSLYLIQDGPAYNFDVLKRIYLIEYGHKIIGATSPVTLFFPTANDLTHARIRLGRNDLLFDDKYTPLYEREAEFQKYVHLLFKATPSLQKKMQVFDAYLEKNRKKLASTNPSLYETIITLDPAALKTQYDELNTGKSGETVEVLDVPLRKKKWEDTVQPLRTSDFAIRSSRYTGAMKPLVLQNNLNKPWRYVNDVWNYDIKVPYTDAEPILEKRSLPGLKIKYPYLTVSDFLEPALIRLIYPIDSGKFFDGNLTGEPGKPAPGYILPLKTRFFDFFSPDDLLDGGPGKPAIRLEQNIGSSIKVILKIPVQRPDEFIVFERIYYSGAAGKQNGGITDDPNSGEIVEHECGLSIFPFIKIDKPGISPYYRIQLIDRDVSAAFRASDYNLGFFSGSSNTQVPIKATKIRSSKKGDAASSLATTKYYVLEQNFDYIQVRIENAGMASGIIVPRWPVFVPGYETFTFAVDFGTTNTHIEYKTGNVFPRPFDITPADVQLATLFDPATIADYLKSAAAIEELIDEQFIPRLIGNDSDYKFPHRTVIAESHDLNIATETFPLADFNIPFSYEKRPEKDRCQSNLKWAKKEPGNDKRVKAFLEIIIMLLRNKVLFNRGDLAKTRLIWFYPSSMKPGRRAALKAAWDELFAKYFGKETTPLSITESLAPFYYFKGLSILQGGAYKPVVSVDIGGGTTDVVIFQGNNPLLLTSFKFSANTLFGDAFSELGAASANGMIKKYLGYYEGLFRENKLKDLARVLAGIREKNRSEDINTFFFSVVNNSRITNKEDFSYNLQLAKDDDLKVLFLYFYSAIVYHIASLMKYRNVALPKHLVFSGTGSKILTIVTSDKKILSRITRKIFETVYNQTFDADGITVEREIDKPKEVTCKGALMVNAQDLDIEIEEIKTVFSGLENGPLYYGQLTDSDKAAIAKNVEDFNQFFIRLNKEYSFMDNFNVSPGAWKLFTEEINKHLRDYLEEGLLFNRNLDQTGIEQTPLEESPFFYPIIGAINNLVTQLSALSPVNQNQ